jgi:hypothetical protein
MDDFEITRLHRFEGDTDPSGEAVVNSVDSKQGKIGHLVSGLGISSEGMSA